MQYDFSRGGDVLNVLAKFGWLLLESGNRSGRCKVVLLTNK